METDREKISFKRDQEDDINSIKVVYEVVHDSPIPEVNAKSWYEGEIRWVEKLMWGFHGEKP